MNTLDQLMLWLIALTLACAFFAFGCWLSRKKPTDYKARWSTNVFRGW